MLRYVIIAIVIVVLLIAFNQLGRQLSFPGRIYGTGEQVDNLTTTDVDGKPVRLSDYQGKVILLNFFASWCAPCNDEAPHLEKDLYQKYKDRGFQVIGIVHEDTPENAKFFRQQHQLTYPLWVKPKGEMKKRLNPSHIPWNILINRRGIVVYSGPALEPEAISKHVRKLLDMPS